MIHKYDIEEIEYNIIALKNAINVIEKYDEELYEEGFGEFYNRMLAATEFVESIGIRNNDVNECRKKLKELEDELYEANRNVFNN